MGSKMHHCASSPMRSSSASRTSHVLAVVAGAILGRQAVLVVRRPVGVAEVGQIPQSPLRNRSTSWSRRSAIRSVLDDIQRV